ncbi:4-phosphopantetheinyl transferase [Actinomadura logoneensis]|uniref:4-phosphopantetheinyl transferase n=1 Tax=Actinomadura logoneensis TaxID=2293572 RepID=A0A372JL51_9ACTN|nr:4'-phosphopantetheinyl transferase superfamily protein [Actinomadura logoneensis]RFU40574.1 4-phosphopantetheinyl transferase [Actinomadura logoneensis]
MEPVTVWWAQRSAATPALTAVLDPVERSRRDRYLRDADRDRFTLGVALTRFALGGLLGLPPERVEIDRSCSDCDKPHGRPRVAGRPDAPHVSVSHSGDRVGVAVSAHGPLGLDVEESRKISDDIARHVLAPGETAATPAELLVFWTRKEALLKATGDGLRFPMPRLRTSPAHERPRLLYWDGRDDHPGRFVLHDLAPGPGYAAHLALLDHPDGVTVHQRPSTDLLP